MVSHTIARATLAVGLACPVAGTREGRGGVGLISCRFGFGGFGGVACISGVRTGTEK